MRIAIFGTGGVGGYFGGRLAQAGEDVIFIGRGDHLRAMQANGLKVDSIKGDFAVQPVQASDDPQQIGIVDAVLVCVKAWQVTDAAKSMRPMVGPDTFVVPLENGIEAPQELADELGEQHTLGGLCRILSFIEAPGHIRHTSIEPYVAFGELDGRPSERAQRLLEAFERAGVRAEIPADIQADMWKKFLLVVAWSGIGAVTRAPLGVTRTLPETRRMLEGSMMEIIQVARARGIDVQEDVVATGMAFFDSVSPDGTASLQRDIVEGRPSELEAQPGAVVRLGQEAGVATPINSFIYHALLPQELAARGEVPAET